MSLTTDLGEHTRAAAVALASVNSEVDKVFESHSLMSALGADNPNLHLELLRNLRIVRAETLEAIRALYIANDTFGRRPKGRPVKSKQLILAR